MDGTNRRQRLRAWAPQTERGWQRLAVSGALAAAVAAGGWAWTLPTAPVGTAYADDMGHTGHDMGQGMPDHGGMAAAPPAMPGQQARAQMATETPVEIRQFAYDPTPLEIPAGTTVTWTNSDAAPHSVTAADGTYDSGLFEQGAMYSFTFDAPGTYAYVCSRHVSMKGEVSVL